MGGERVPDDELARKAVSGDVSSFEELVRRHMNVVVGFAFSYTGDAFAAEDLAQEAFIKAFESLRNLEDPSKFGGWLRVICRNTCADYVRTRRTPVSLEALREAGQEPTDLSSLSPLDDISGSETESAILREIASLREDYREIIVLRHIEDLSYRKIASILEMSVSAGEKLSRVRDILRRRLRKKVR